MVFVYCVGLWDELFIEVGVVYFFEYMMFKGLENFVVGEIDCVIESWGGSNNVFMSYDVIVYYFFFVQLYWVMVFEIECDCMGGLCFDVYEVDVEWQVIFEELVMYESDFWDVLYQELLCFFYLGYFYGVLVFGM